MFKVTTCKSRLGLTGGVSTLTLLGCFVLFAISVLGQATEPKGNPEEEFTLRGTIANAKSHYLYLLYGTSLNDRKLDSSRIVDGRFEFRGKIAQPVKAILRENRNTIPDDINLNIATIFLDKGDIIVDVVHDDFKSMKVMGSKAQRDYDKFNELFYPYSKKYVTLRDQISMAKKEKHSQPIIDSLDRATKEAIREMRSVSYQFILNNPDAYVSADQLSLLKNEWPHDTVMYLYKNLSPEIKSSNNGIKIYEMIRAKEKAAVGTMAADFSERELNGQMLKLSDFRGKYVLVDFWGSWCAPCREGNPHLIEVYNRYKDKNFEIIGVASGDKDAAWRKAVEKDRIGIWKNIMDTDTESRGTVIAHTFGVFSYPTKILIDKSGKIVGRFEEADSKKMDDLLARTLE